MIKINDRVSHAYNIKLVGRVISIIELPAKDHFEGGTSARRFAAVVEIDNKRGETFTASTNDLMKEV